MDIELGIANVARPVTFSTEEDAASVTEPSNRRCRPEPRSSLTDDKAVASSCRRTRRIRAHRLRDQAPP